MNRYYSDEKNILILIALLKAHGIKRIIASPGNTNLTLVASLQQDPFFEIFSSVDERSAAYMACGMAAETGQPVMLSCTGATASRNYIPALTEAFYRKLPILTVTSCRSNAEIGHLIPQVIDRRKLPSDIAKLSVQLPIVKDDMDSWECNIKINQAILALSHRGGGPVHINIPTIYCPTYNTKELPAQRVVNRLFPYNELPSLKGKKVAILVGSHQKWSVSQMQAVDSFCEHYNSAVFCDHTSGYNGKYRIQYSLIGCQEQFVNNLGKLDVLIHIGEISGDYFTTIGKFFVSQVWRVSEDGEIHDTFRKLKYVFEMREEDFFNRYNSIGGELEDSYYQDCIETYSHLYERILQQDLPYSNIWMASRLSHRLPQNSVVHFSILSSLRSWNFFKIPASIESQCNVGGFGIDGCMSSLIGASLLNKEKLYFGVIGDLAFFYDMNVMGNRHMGNNVRILLVNNGVGMEFKLYCYPGSKLGEDTDPYIAAKGHYGQKSHELVRHYAQDLGFEYMSASNKEEFEQHINKFLAPELTSKPMLFEVFTSSEDENKALEMTCNVEKNSLGVIKKISKSILTERVQSKIRKMLKS